MKLWFYDLMMEICWKLEDIYGCFGRLIGLTSRQIDKFYPSSMWEDLSLAEAHRRKKVGPPNPRPKPKTKEDLSKTKQRLRDIGAID